METLVVICTFGNLIADEAALATAASIQELIKKIDWSKDISNK